MPLSPVLVLIAALAQSPEGAGAPDLQADGPVTTAPMPSGPLTARPAPPSSDDDEDIAPPTPSAPVPYQPSGVRPFEMSGSMPGGAVPYSPFANDHVPDAPVSVEAYRHSYEGPLNGTEKAYEAGVKRNFDAQQVRMGPLDGAWTVRTQSGGAFMGLMLADRGRADTEVEGAWRTLSGRPGQARSGFLLSVAREGQTLVVRWYPSDDTGNITIMRLNPTPDGRWTGAVRTRDVEFPVTMSRGPTPGSN